MKNDILNICDQLVAAATNGVYQGIMITLLVAVCLRWLVRTNAATRHAVWFCTLLLLVALVVAHCLVGSFSLRRVKSDVAAPASNVESTIPATGAAVLSETEANAGKSSDDFDNFHDEWSRADQHPLIAAMIQVQKDNAEDVAEPMQPKRIELGKAQNDNAGLTSHLSIEKADFRWLLERVLNPISVKLAVGSKVPWIASAILAVWLMIAGFRVFALIAQLVQILKLKRQSLFPGAELAWLFQRLSASLVTNRQVELRVSPSHRSSFLLGFVHPVVLLPMEERMELAEVELVLRHELAHVERCDDWVNLIQHFLLAIFFFHPAFWWISRQLSLEREIACDDHVLQQSKRPQTYALVLANLASRMQQRLQLLAPGSSNNKTQLKERIDMILNTHRNACPRLAKAWLALITLIATVVASAISLAAPRIVLA